MKVTVLKPLFFCASILVVILTFVSADAHAARSRFPGGCTTVYTLPNSLFIYKNSAPVRDASGVMIGLRYEPTLIMKKVFPAGSTTIYSTSGARLGSCPKAQANGAAGGRMRCTMKTASLRRSAVQSGGTAVFFTLGRGFCAKIPDAGKCYGSTKGACNTTVK